MTLYFVIFFSKAQLSIPVSTSTYFSLPHNSSQSNMALEREMYGFHDLGSNGANRGAAPANRAEIDADRAALWRLGKKQVLKASDFG